MKTTIECTNCGGGGNDLQFFVTLGALLIAAIALAMNFVQFREYLRGLRARAEFTVTLHLAGADSDGVRRTKAGKTAVRVAVGIKNEGKKAAGETLVNALVPRNLENVRWSGPGGQQIDEPKMTTPTDEKLVGPDGMEYEAKYLVRTLPRVGTKPHHLVHFQFYAETRRPGDSVVIPVRVKVQADEIPDEIEDYVEDLSVRVERFPRQ
jgi:hypothetical protein